MVSWLMLFSKIFPCQECFLFAEEGCERQPTYMEKIKGILRDK